MSPFHQFKWENIAKFADEVTNAVRREDVAEPELPPRRMELRCNKRELMLLAPEQLRQRLIDLDAEARKHGMRVYEVIEPLSHEFIFGVEEIR